MANLRLAPGLYWNERGMINCEKHAPMKGSDTWKWERWQKVQKCPETADLVCEVCELTAKRAAAK